MMVNDRTGGSPEGYVYSIMSERQERNKQLTLLLRKIVEEVT